MQQNTFLRIAQPVTATHQPPFCQTRIDSLPVPSLDLERLSAGQQLLLGLPTRSINDSLGCLHRPTVVVCIVPPATSIVSFNRFDTCNSQSSLDLLSKVRANWSPILVDVSNALNWSQPLSPLATLTLCSAA